MWTCSIANVISTFVITNHMLDWHSCQICYPLEYYYYCYYYYNRRYTKGFINVYSFKHNIVMGMPFSSSLHRGFHFCQGDHNHLLESQNRRFWRPVWVFFLLRSTALHIFQYSTEHETLFHLWSIITYTWLELYQWSICHLLSGVPGNSIRSMINYILWLC